MGGLVEALLEEIGDRGAGRCWRVHEQFVVEAEDDAGIQFGTSGAHGDGPDLEQLGGCALDDRVAGVATPSPSPGTCVT